MLTTFWVCVESQLTWCLDISQWIVGYISLRDVSHHVFESTVGMVFQPYQIFSLLSLLPFPITSKYMWIVRSNYKRNNSPPIPVHTAKRIHVSTSQAFAIENCPSRPVSNQSSHPSSHFCIVYSSYHIVTQSFTLFFLVSIFSIWPPWGTTITRSGNNSGCQVQWFLPWQYLWSHPIFEHNGCCTRTCVSLFMFPHFPHFQAIVIRREDVWLRWRMREGKRLMETQDKVFGVYDGVAG